MKNYNSFNNSQNNDVTNWEEKGLYNSVNAMLNNKEAEIRILSGIRQGWADVKAVERDGNTINASIMC